MGVKLTISEAQRKLQQEVQEQKLRRHEENYPIFAYFWNLKPSWECSQEEIIKRNKLFERIQKRGW